MKTPTLPMRRGASRPLSAPPSSAVAELKGVSKTYHEVRAVDDLDLKVGRGEVLALLGPNGAGKTTSVNLLLGLIRPTSGSVSLFGHKPHAAEARVRTGALLQISNVPETLRVGEHIELFSSYYPCPLPTSKVIAAAGLAGLEKRQFGKLSGGQRQRLLFALAICGDPDLIFLDEPTVGLDVEARRGLWTAIHDFVDRGKTVVLTTHHLEEADALAHRIVLIDQGKIVAQGSPAEIKGRVGGRTIRCRTSLDAGRIQDLPGVSGVRETAKGSFEILAAQAEEITLRLLTLDPELSGLEVREAALEEAFLLLTGRDPASPDRQALQEPVKAKETR